MANFGKDVTPGTTGWVNLLSLMQANGYTGGARLIFLTITEDLGNAVRVKTGHSSNTIAPVSATDGKPVVSETFWHIDAPLVWIHFSVDAAIGISASSPLDF